MRFATTIASAALLGAVMAGSVHAQLDAFRGNRLKEFCDDYSSDRFGLYGATCSGYVNGVADALASTSLFCFPEGVEREQSILVVKKYLSDNPGKLHLEADILVVEALGAAFPCPAVSTD